MLTPKISSENEHLKEQMILVTEMIPAIQGPSLAMAEKWCQQVWRSSLAPGLHHALASLFVELAKSKGWPPNDPDGLLVTLGLASNGQQQAWHPELPFCWEGLKWATDSTWPVLAPLMTAWSAACPLFPGVGYEMTSHRNKVLVPWLYEADYLIASLGEGEEGENREKRCMDL